MSAIANNENFIKSSVTKNDNQKLLDELRDIKGWHWGKGIKLLHDIINQMHRTVSGATKGNAKMQFLFKNKKKKESEEQ